VKNLNFLGGKDITWFENNFEPIPKKYILGKDDIILNRDNMRTAHQNKRKTFTLFTNFSPKYKSDAWGNVIRYDYDIYDVKFNKKGAIVGAGRGEFMFDVDEKYPLLHNRYEYTLNHRNYYMFKQSIHEFMNWLNNPLEE
jgi:hypothetical protein